MTCTTSTAPINISDKDYSDECSLKCLFQYNYPASPATTITNEGNYLAISYDKVKINYNNSDLLVNGMRLYTPSLHNFDGEEADGELIINHVDMGISLLVCIPIVISTKASNASKSLSYLLGQAITKTPNAGEKAVVSVNNFTLNDFIPKKSPFYSYTATLPYSPCNGTHQYIVYMPKDTTLFISPKLMSDLQKIILPHDSAIKPKLDYFLNKRGAVFQDPSSDGGDDIYIDCQPTGADGEPIPVPNSNAPKSPPFNFKNPIVIILVSIICASALIFIIYWSVKNFKSRSSTSATASEGGSSLPVDVSQFEEL